MLNIVRLLSAVLIIVQSSDGSMIPFLPNVSLVSSYPVNTTFSYNQTTQSCLCIASTSYIAFNWFPNGTCQFFTEFPRTYTLKPEIGPRLYFPQGIFPNTSQCSASNLTQLLQKLRNATQRSVNATNVRNLIIDENGYLLAVQVTPPKFYRFHSENLTLVNQTSLATTSAYSFESNDGAIFTVQANISVTAFNSQTLTTLSTSTSSYLQNSRSIIFMDQGNTMVVSAFDLRNIVFFKRNASSNYQYTFDYRLVVNYSTVRGLTYVNDNQFYATDYTTRRVYSYTRLTNSTSWNGTLLIDARSIYNGTGGASVTIDPDGRIWFLLQGPVILIYDKNGVFLSSFNVSSTSILHALITDKYVLYLTDFTTSQNRIIRIDPNLDC